MSGVKIIVQNKKAYYNFAIEELRLDKGDIVRIPVKRGGRKTDK